MKNARNGGLLSGRPKIYFFTVFLALWLDFFAFWAGLFCFLTFFVVVEAAVGAAWTAGAAGT